MKLRITLAASLIAAGVIAASTAAFAATESSDIAVRIENQAITLTNEAALNFGTVLPFGREGEVKIHPTGAPSVNNAFISDPTLLRASEWSVTGVPNAPFGVVLPNDNTVSVSNGSETMIVTEFTASDNNPDLDGQGNATFTVGAALIVNANQAPGDYTGQFEVTVAYN